jgi:hypothetical protein
MTGLIIIGLVALLYGTAATAAHQRTVAVAQAIHAAAQEAAGKIGQKEEYCPCRGNHWNDAVPLWSYDPDHPNLSRVMH